VCSAAFKSAAVRIGLTAGCATVVLVVPELELLIVLLGALCQASLSALPPLISLRLAAVGLVPLSRPRTALHVVLLSLCALAAVTGTYCALSDIALFIFDRGREPER
jgi:hypothetical protein